MAACFRMRAALLGSAAILFPLYAFAQDTLLEPIIVESKREVATGTAAPVTTIDQREIDDRQAGTIAELIDSVPGVTLMNGSTPAGSGINIRGFGATTAYGTDGMVLIQVDGATQGSEELYRIATQLYTDPALYKQVDVQRGTVGSFEYGSGVVGGLVRLRTKDASDFTGGVPGWAGRQTLEFGSNGNGITSSSILAWQPTDNLEFLAQYAWRKLEEQQDGDGEDTGAAGFIDPSYLLKGKYTFGAGRNQSIALSHNFTDSSQRDVPYNQLMNEVGFSFGNVDRDIKTRTTILAYEWDPASPLWRVEANLSYVDSRIDSAYIPGSSPLGDMVAYLGDADHEYETTQLTLKNAAEFATGAVDHELRTGIEFIHKKRKDNTGASAPGGTDERVALFAVDEATMGGWTFSPAIRYETQELHRAKIDADLDNPQTQYENDGLVGGLSVRYEWQNGFSLFASGAYTETLPILDDFEVAANMSKPQNIRTWEIGGAYEMSSLMQMGDALEVKANLYETTGWDMTSYTGIGKMKMQGIEMEAAYSLANGFYADMNANIVHGESWTTAGVYNPYWTNAPADRLRLTLGKRFGDELDLSVEAVANARYDRTATDEVPGSVVGNIRATYTPQAGVLAGTELRLGVENMFDTDYRPRLATRDAAGRNIKFTIAKAF